MYRITLVMLWSVSPAFADDMNLNALLSPVPPQPILQHEDYFIWGAGMVRGPEGSCHLFYSRWPRDKGFNAWVTHSEIAHAVSDEPTGPYRHVNVALPARGAQFWDGLCTHNPTVHIPLIRPEKNDQMR